MRWQPIKNYFEHKEKYDWVLVQFKEKNTDFYPIPKVCEYRLSKGWCIQAEDEQLEHYLNNNCEAVAFIDIPKYRGVLV